MWKYEIAIGPPISFDYPLNKFIIQALYIETTFVWLEKEAKKLGGDFTSNFRQAFYIFIRKYLMYSKDFQRSN